MKEKNGMDEETKQSLENMSMQTLIAKQSLGRFLVRKIRQEWMEENPEQGKRAIHKYENQVKLITEEIKKRRKQEREGHGEEKPPTQTMKMKTAKLGAKTNRS